ncbi:ZIP family metal transporter [Emcibacter sp. SYSU 3D8]|uniref:ZIP family metal transporter n=1 Tax=Emcibacter sp. SYSU 3D8 TaxID=3133969 RepID=UPI0031FF30EF
MYLAAGIAALLIGPAAYQLLQGLSRFRHALDLAVTGVITVLALLILWDTAESGGWLIVAFATAGLAGPLAAEALLHRERGVHAVTLVVGVGGLLLHSAADGAALLSGQLGRHEALSMAVVLHNVPAGLAIWWLVQTNVGTRAAMVVLALLAAATVAGYFAASAVASVASEAEFAWLQAFVAGSLLHLTYHRLRHSHGERERAAHDHGRSGHSH